MTGETPVRQWSLGPKTLIVEPKSTTNPAFYGGLQPVFNADVPDSDAILNEAPPDDDRFSSDRSVDRAVWMNGDVVDRVAETARDPFVPAGVRVLSRRDVHVVDFANRVALSSLAKVRFRFFEAAVPGFDDVKRIDMAVHR